MTEELEQLLRNLRLKRILEIYDAHLKVSEKGGRDLHGLPPRPA
jgi:hypothetical protein